jgi:hypothetical protein
MTATKNYRVMGTRVFPLAVWLVINLGIHTVFRVLSFFLLNTVEPAQDSRLTDMVCLSSGSYDRQFLHGLC